jgi:hypothetical protein
LETAWLTEEREATSYAPVDIAEPFASIMERGRNDALFRYCLRQARVRDGLDALLDAARSHNDQAFLVSTRNSVGGEGGSVSVED